MEAVQLTRFLVSAEGCGLPFLLIFNKADLFTAEQRKAYADHLGHEACLIRTPANACICAAAQLPRCRAMGCRVSGAVVLQCGAERLRGHGCAGREFGRGMCRTMREAPGMIAALAVAGNGATIRCL